MQEKLAIVVVDMLNDFVYGALKCERGLATIEPLSRLLDSARENGIPVIFSNDAHHEGIDHELKKWGDHALVGSEGAQVIPELNQQESDYVVPKKRYSGFFQTDLDLLLRELKVDGVVLAGLHTHMCVRHTAADAYQYGYKVYVAEEATNAFTEEDHVSGIKYLKDVYDAEVLSVDELISIFKNQ
ncbi:MAG: cysteine hydrolase [Erysipelotrichaceae bacterium]|nr:cysteine hydrolase [Erysipelotrichaceae bacterium]